MPDYEYYYRLYRRKYNDACEVISSCDRKIYELQQGYNNASRAINALNAKIRNMERAENSLEEVIRRETPINTKITTVSNKIQQAAVNYSGMVSSSAVANKDLDTVYGEGIRTTQTTISKVFDAVKAKKVILTNNLSNLRKDLCNKQQELDNINAQIRRQKSNRDSWTRQRLAYYHNMEHYRRMMHGWP